jgi:hypothetical protein
MMSMREDMKNMFEVLWTAKHNGEGKIRLAQVASY